MGQALLNISLLVNDYDEAIDFYVNKLHFDLLEDTRLSDEKRWVRVRPKGINSTALLLAKAVGDKQKAQIGDQAGGRVFLFLNTDQFDKDYANLKNNNIKIVRMPKRETYRSVLVFQDLYGNLWDLIEPNN